LSSQLTKLKASLVPMKNFRSLAVLFVSSATLISALADPQVERHVERDVPVEVKPATIPPKPDNEKLSYAVGMNLGLQRKQAAPDSDVPSFIRGLREVYTNQKTDFSMPDTLTHLNAVRAHGAKATADEKVKASYAMGMRWGASLKEAGVNINIDTAIQAFKDVAEGKPTKLKQSELEPLLDAGRNYALYEMGSKNRDAGATFLKAKASEPDVKKIADGLYYKVITNGNGRALSTLASNEMFFIRYKGSFMDGREFDHHNRFPKNLNGGWPAWVMPLKQMKVGDKWQVYSAPEYSFGREGDQPLQVGPDTTVIWDLEVREIIKDSDPRLGTGRLGHGIGGRDNDDDLKELDKQHPIETVKPN
jgi:FKBP-type peptidyl-prolyl cis-trans isomerase FkpA